jgi:hypothetical protein
MLAVEVGEKLGGRSGASGSQILVTATDALDRFCEVLALPLEIGGQSFVEGRRGSWPRHLAYSSGRAFRSGFSGIMSMCWPWFPLTYRKGFGAKVKTYLLAEGAVKW